MLRPWDGLRPGGGSVPGQACLFLTGGPDGPAELCRELTQAGLGELPVTVGENLGFNGEQVSPMTAARCAEKTFAPLNVLLCEPAPRYPRRTPGIPDREFLRAEGVPMTKQEVRAAILSKLAVGLEDVCWDIGAGTGSVSVELALQCKAVWAVERKPEALALARSNREKFGAWNLRLVEGSAPLSWRIFPPPMRSSSAAAAESCPKYCKPSAGPTPRPRSASPPSPWRPSTPQWRS